MRRYLPKNTEELLRWYERYVSPLSLLAGFLADNFFLLKRVDLFRTNALLFFYLLVAALAIVLINMLEAGRLRAKWMIAAAPFIPVIAQFCFGGLFSGYLSLYSRSASLAVSWIFVVALALLLFGNERFTRLYSRFPFQIGLYFFVLFSFLEFFLPVVFHQIGPYMFFAAGLLSLTLITLFMLMMRRLAPVIARAGAQRAIMAIVVIFFAFNVLYFGNVIPPLPLSLKDAGVYHSVVRLSDGSYQLEGESVPWYKSFLRYNDVFHQTPGGQVYVYASVFAPSGLNTEVLHQWQYYNPATQQWKTTDTISYPIAGGLDGGYKGYSYKGYLTPGSWRVNIITQYGQIIGQVAFTVENATEPPTLETSTE
ncbi:MAG TPA: DUF2914 domain-containing protein [Candidatus Paceibacterota bacterium]|nr:DUF2914 domain-containing protein [Candidatus Paceibacterota bacterium]